MQTNTSTKTRSREFEELLEILKTAKMAGDAPFSRYMNDDGQPGASSQSPSRTK